MVDLLLDDDMREDIDGKIRRRKMVLAVHPEFAIHSTKENKKKSEILKRKRKRIEDVERMKNMRLQRRSLQDIGDSFGVTREAIRLSLKRYYPQIDFNRAIQKNQIKEVTLKCIVCSKERIVLGYKHLLKIKYCSKKCMHEGLGWEFFPVSRSKLPIEERRAYWNRRTKIWYEAHKNEDEWKARIKKYNTLAYLKRMLKAEKITQKLYDAAVNKVKNGS